MPETSGDGEIERAGEGEVPRPALKPTAGKKLRFPARDQGSQSPVPACSANTHFLSGLSRCVLWASGAVRSDVRRVSGLCSLRGGGCDLPLLVPRPARDGEEDRAVRRGPLDCSDHRESERACAGRSAGRAHPQNPTREPH